MDKCTMCSKQYEDQKEVNNHGKCPDCRSLSPSIMLEGNLLQEASDNEQQQASSEDRESQMRQKVEVLTRECQKNSEKLIEAQQECAELKTKLKCEVQNRIMLLEQKNTLEEKLKLIQLELQKEIRHSMELSMDKMRLEVMMERGSASCDVAANECIKQDIAGKKTDHKKVVNATKSIRNGMIIKGFKEIVSARETVLKLGRQMQLCVGESGIEEAVVHRRFNNISLVAGFKTKTLLDLFVAHADKLKYYPETRHLEICAYSATTDLLGYAKKLKHFGFKYVYIHQNFVYARKDKKTTPIKILNKETVDEILKSSKHTDAAKPNETSAQSSTTVITKTPEGPKIF